LPARGNLNNVAESLRLSDSDTSSTGRELIANKNSVLSELDFVVGGFALGAPRKLASDVA
jgi:hypothetical protein